MGSFPGGRSSAQIRPPAKSDLDFWVVLTDGRENLHEKTDTLDVPLLREARSVEPR
jgi:hypothetical protein